VSARLERGLARTRHAAFVVLGYLLLVQVTWTVVALIIGEHTAADLYYPLLFAPAVALLWATRGRARWATVLPRLLIALSFVVNVADRLGAFGPPGAPGVSWGDFAHFTAYTAKVNAFAPAAVIPALAVVATVAEGALGVAMLLGVGTRIAAAGSALLLFAFATAMMLSGLSQLQYGVYLMAAGAWAMATVDATALGLDAIRGAAPVSNVPSPPGRGSG
jgi:putative oxidoreductase